MPGKWDAICDRASRKLGSDDCSSACVAELPEATQAMHAIDSLALGFPQPDARRFGGERDAKVIPVRKARLSDFHAPPAESTPSKEAFSMIDPHGHAGLQLKFGHAIPSSRVRAPDARASVAPPHPALPSRAIS